MRVGVIALCCTALLVAACQRTESWKPPAFGADTCGTCSAVVATPRFAAQLQRADGTIVSFDDPACLFRALGPSPDAPRTVRFHDETADGWVEGGAAWFARMPNETTPHGDGWVAFSSFAAAQDAVAAAGGGEILPFNQLRERLAR